MHASFVMRRKMGREDSVEKGEPVAALIKKMGEIRETKANKSRQ